MKKYCIKVIIHPKRKEDFSYLRVHSDMSGRESHNDTCPVWCPLSAPANKHFAAYTFFFTKKKFKVKFHFHPLSVL